MFGKTRCGCGRTMPSGRSLCPQCTRTNDHGVESGGSPTKCSRCGRTKRGGICPGPDC